MIHFQENIIIETVSFMNNVNAQWFGTLDVLGHLCLGWTTFSIARESDLFGSSLHVKKQYSLSNDICSL